MMLPEQFGQYTLTRLLAVGGMGELYLAKREGVAGFAKQMVVKRIRPGLADDPQFVQMFLNEGRVAAMIDHPNVVHIYDLGEFEGSYYMAMEYIEGKDLGNIISANGALELPIALYVMNSVCEGLDFAHEVKGLEGQHLQLVHRDINPQNVLISFSGAVKITDFGIAKVHISSRTKTRVGVLKGKFGYLSPEQALSKMIDRRSDIYALGLLLFEMSIGKPAIPGETDTELLLAAANGIVQRPMDFSASFPPDLERIYVRATANNPDDRYQTVKEMQEDLLRFQVEERMVITSSKVANLMRRLFSTDPDKGDKGSFSLREMMGLDQNIAGHSSEKKGTEEDLHATLSIGESVSKIGLEALEETMMDLPEAPDDLKRDHSISKTVMAPSENTMAPEPGFSHPASYPSPQSNSGYSQVSRGTPQGSSPGYAQVSRGTPQGSSPGLHQGGESEEELSRDDDLDKRPLVKHQAERPRFLKEASLTARRLIITFNIVLVLGAGGAIYHLVHEKSEPDSDTPRADGKKSTNSSISSSSRQLPTSVRADARAIPSSKTVDASASTTVRTPDLRASPDLTTASSPPHPRKKRKSRKTGKVHISCKPAVDVFVHNRRLGKVPIQTALPAGRHQLRLQNRNLGIRVRRWITVRAGQLVRKTITLEPGTLVIKVRPWAYIEVNGVRRGTTPIRPIKLYEGTYHIRLINPEHVKPYTTRVTIESGKKTKLVHRFSK